MHKLQSESFAAQANVFCEDAPVYTAAFMTVLQKVNNKEATKYTLTTLDELCKENSEIAKLLKALAGSDKDPVDVVSQLLSREDEIIVARACLVLVHCFNAGLPASEGTTRKLMDYVRVELQREGKHKPFVYLSIMALLQGLLRAHERRLAFIDAKGLDMLLTLIRDGKNQSNTQVSDSSVCGTHTYLHSYMYIHACLIYERLVQDPASQSRFDLVKSNQHRAPLREG